MADTTNGVAAVKEASAIISKKLIAYCIGNIVLLVLAFTGKIQAESISSTLLILNAGYFGSQGFVDIATAVKGAISKRNGSNGNGTSGGSVTATTPPA